MAGAPLSPDLPGATDLFSNATRIVPQPDEDPRPWLGAVASGNGQLLTFIHEATHNWCFSSAVVHAQLHLAARAQINSTALVALRDENDEGVTPSEDSPTRVLGLAAEVLHALGEDPRPLLGENARAVRDELELAVHDDVIRLEVIQALLRPLAEGLAMFAEYDALSRAGSKAWSPLPMAVTWNFAGFDRLKDQGTRGFVEPFTTGLMAGEFIAKARLSSQALNAKASVLAQPLASEADGYLPGYLAVKSMWRHLYRQAPRLYAESDLVLAYLRSYFFEDVAFAAAILAPPQANSFRSSSAIVQAFAYRMSDFARVTGADVAAFEDHIASLSYDKETPIHTPGLLYSEEEDQSADARIKKAIDDYAKSSIGARSCKLGVRNAMTELDRIWRQRPFLITCSVPVTIDHEPGTDGIRVLWREIPILPVPPEDLTPPTPLSDGRDNSEEPVPEPQLDILLGTSGTATLSRAAVVSRGRQVISCTTWGPSSTRDVFRQQILAEFASRDERLRGVGAFQAIAELIVEESWGLRSNRDHVRAQTNKIVDDIYRDTALKYARSYEAIDRCAELMKDDGLYALFRSANMLKRISLLGLAASLNSYKEQINRVFRERGYDLQDTLHQLSRCWDRHGFPPSVMESGGEEGEREGNLLVPFV